MSIHPSAVISDHAVIADDVTIGPNCLIMGDVKIGKGTRIEGNVAIGHASGKVIIGENNHFFPSSAIGGPPQDLKYQGETTELRIGDDNIVREFVTMNCGTGQGGGLTKVGSNNLFMTYSHVAHDCDIGNRVVMANSCQCAGHVTIEDNVIVGGICAVSQFSRIGKNAYIAGFSAVNKDVLPFTIAQGIYAVMRATNKIGLSRAGYEKPEVENIHKCIRSLIMGSRLVDEALVKINEDCEMTDNIKYILSFIEKSKNGLAK